ncbi:MAG: hypothetical protein HLUCCA08_06315 [Rhodobacteraceae bacterium HLUCCA08]|nr:MAG: hypothetical protein HLUCCA08_06315 [Rhodobacteraceae bacterium HLUCCA08]
MKRFLAVLTASLCMGAPVVAATLSVTTSSGTQNLSTLQGDASAADFYAYDNGTFNGPLTLSLGSAYLFAYEQTGASDLSLGMIFTGTDIDPAQHCRGADAKTCRTKFAGDLSGLDPDSNVLVRDDRANAYGDEDASAPGANGYYWMYAFTGSTDGFVTDGFSRGSTVSMDVRKYVNFDQAYWIGGPIDAPTLTQLDLSGGYTITAPAPQQRGPSGGQPSPVPLPGGLVLLGSALGLAAWGKRRKA